MKNQMQITERRTPISIFQTVKAAIITRQAAEFYGQSVTPNGMMLCLFHDDRHPSFYIDEDEAAVVREIYERYAAGESKKEIIDDLRRRNIKTSLGKDFGHSSLGTLLQNKRYIGIYLYKGKETPGGMPRILDDDLFYRVQDRLQKNKHAPARTQGEGEYLLTTKLFSGHCQDRMVGHGGTGKSGKHYILQLQACKEAAMRQTNCQQTIH